MIAHQDAAKRVFYICLQYNLQSDAISGFAHGTEHIQHLALADYVARARRVVLMQKALLQGGWMSYRTPENRIRVKITNKSLMLVDLTIQGQSWQCVISFQPASLLVVSVSLVQYI